MTFEEMKGFSHNIDQVSESTVSSLCDTDMVMTPSLIISFQHLSQILSLSVIPGQYSLVMAPLTGTKTIYAIISVVQVTFILKMHLYLNYFKINL